MIPKKILVISANVSHPQSDGGKRRIYNFLYNLKKLGYEIHFLYDNQDLFGQKANIKSMRRIWDKVYVLGFNVHIIINYFDSLVGKIGLSIKYMSPTLYKRIKKIIGKNTNQSKINRDVKIDNLYNPILDKYIKKVSKQNTYDAVLVEYIFQSKALENFDNSVLKVIDTHDAWSSEHAVELKKHFDNKTFKIEIKNFYSVEDEKKCLNRADIIIAIQDEEKKYFSKLTKKKIVTIGHIVNLCKPIKRTLGRKNILFVGFANSENKYGINFFIKDVFPKIKLEFPKAKFLIVGSVCNFIEAESGVVKLGYVKNISEAYSLADVVICPIFFGCGLKIKAVEALSFCKPLVITSFASKGLWKSRNKAFLIANSAEKFAECIIKIFKHENIFENLSENAYDFIKNYNDIHIKRLKKLF